MTDILEKCFDFVLLLVSRFELSGKWWAWLVHLPATVFWVFFADMNLIIPALLDEKGMLFAFAAVWLLMWWNCRRERWLWVLPYLCLAKVLLYGVL